MSWNTTNSVAYIYDNRRVIQERNYLHTNLPATSYTRGRDLSGTLEGAGGIGGLLARSSGYSSGNWTTHDYYHADGNGNVTALVDSSQSVVASYTYDPFGNTLASSGTLASANVYGFSSKEFLVNSGLYYYGYRFYDPSLQRWLNRDPALDLSFLRRPNPPPSKVMALCPYLFVNNDPIMFWDYLGLDNPSCDPPGNLVPGSCPTKRSQDCMLRCCAAHDACYFANGCGALSWVGNFFLPASAWGPCQACNAGVSGCMVSCAAGAGPQSGPRWFCANGPHAGTFYDDYSQIPASCWAGGRKPPQR